MANLGAIVQKIREARALRPQATPGPRPNPPPKPGSGEVVSRYPTVSLLCAFAIVGAVVITVLIPILATVVSRPPTTAGAVVIQALGPVTVAPVPAIAGAVAPSEPLINGPAETGTLSGTIRLQGDSPVRRIVGTLPSGVQILDESLLVDAQTKGIANAVVYLAHPPAGAVIPRAPASPAVLGISGATYVPRILVARTGQQVVAINSDPVLRSVHSAPVRNEAINVVLPSAFAALWKFTKPENSPVKITSDYDPSMTAWIVVLDHPWVAVTDNNGVFKIEGLPRGAHELTVWHERSGYLARKVTITIDEQQISELDLSIPESRFGG